MRLPQACYTLALPPPLGPLGFGVPAAGGEVTRLSSAAPTEGTEVFNEGRSTRPWPMPGQ